MASGLKYSVALATTCIASAVLIQLWHPLNIMPVYERRIRADWPVRNRIIAEAAKAYRLQKQYLLVDSLLPRMPRAPGSLIIEQSPFMAENEKDVRAIAESQLRERKPLHARLGLFVINNDYGHYPGSEVPGYAAKLRIIAGSDDAGPYCLAVHTLPASAKVPHGISLNLQSVPWDRGKHPLPLFGPCEFWAQYGPPGAGVDRWLRQGGYRFAQAPAYILDAAYYPRRLEIENERRLFGQRYYYRTSFDGIACRAGTVERCDALLGTTTPRDTVSWVAFESFGTRYDNGGALINQRERGMLAYIERQYGSARFASFWHSTKPVDAAFRDAFGVSMGIWTRDWAQEKFGVESRGPRISTYSLLLCALLLATLTFASYLAARYRQVH